jgi:hypothetical protein
MRPHLLVTLCALLTACHLDADVDNSGDYAIATGAPIADTAPLPLRHLLVIEQDLQHGAVLITLYSGDLPAANLGLQDLRRIGTQHNRYQMAFDTPLSTYTEAATEAATESESESDTDTDTDTDPDSDADADSDSDLRLRVNRAAVPLQQLDSDTLYETGASRRLRTLDSADYDVRAYVAVVQRDAARLATLELQTDAARFTARLDLNAPGLRFEQDEEVTHVAHGKLPGADYVEIELLQRLTRIPQDTDAGAEDRDAGAGDAEDPERVEALVRTSLWPTTQYQATPELLTDVTGQGCWNEAQPLTARLIQTARSYQQNPAGDLAIIHRRLDALTVEPERWTPALQTVTPSAYCENYE